MKPLLYHLEYHLENGYFDRFPKGQAIKLVVGNDGGIQTLHGRGTGSGRVLFSTGKSVLFAMDKAREELKVVFRAYSDDKLLGEAVKIFKETSFPKRTEVGEPASYTFGSDMAFRKASELVGAVKAFIRVTSFGENIISDCIKDGESYRVRMTSLIVERNKDPRKTVKPWWVILDGRRLRFSRWLRALEKEDCAKDVFLKVKKCCDVDNLPAVSEVSISEEDEAAFESVEAALKRDFDSIQEFGSQETYDKCSQVDFTIDPSFYDFQIKGLQVKSNESCCCEQNKISTFCSTTNSPDVEKEEEFKYNIRDTLSSSEITPNNTRSCINNMKESGVIVSEQDKNSQNHQNTKDLVCTDINPISDHDSKTNDKSNIMNINQTKADDIFHLERSTSDLVGGNDSTESSGVGSVISEALRASDLDVEIPTVSGRSFLSETIVRELINEIIERISEREFCSLEEQAIEELMLATKEDSSSRALRAVGFGDTESLMDLSVLGIVKQSACVDLSTPTTPDIASNCSTASIDESLEDKDGKKSPKTILIRSNKMAGLELSNEEFSSETCTENKYITPNDLRQQSDVSCILIKCKDQSNLEDSLCYRPGERSIGTFSEGNESNEGLSDTQLYPKNKADNMNPTMSSVNYCISEWARQDEVTPCFTCDKETKDDVAPRERWRRTIITNQTNFVESSSLPKPDDVSRTDFTYSNDEVQMTSSNSHNSPNPESESKCSISDKISMDYSLVSQVPSEEMRFAEEFQGIADTSETDFILENDRSTLIKEISCKAVNKTIE